MATSLTLRNDPTLQQGYVQVNGTTSATFTTSGITGNLTGNVTGNADTATKLSTTTGSAPAYACRAWVNFDGTRDTTGAVSTSNTNRLIRSSGNVTSVLRNAIGDYTITFTTAMTNANYAVVCGSMNRQASGNSTPDQTGILVGATNTAILKTTTQLSIGYMGGGGAYDGSEIHVAIFGN